MDDHEYTKRMRKFELDLREMARRKNKFASDEMSRAIQFVMANPVYDGHGALSESYLREIYIGPQMATAISIFLSDVIRMLPTEPKDCPGQFHFNF